MQNIYCFQLLKCDDLFFLSIYLLLQLEYIWNFGQLIGQNMEFKHINLASGEL